jgi:hypothetical protein
LNAECPDPVCPAVPITLQPTFRKLGEPREVFNRSFANVSGYSEDVAGDARSFLMLIPEREQGPVTELHVVANWSEELKRRVPAGAATEVPR